MTTRPVHISLLYASPQIDSKIVRFIPDLASADPDMLLERFYEAEVEPDEEGNGVSGTIALPVRAGAAISYRVELPDSDARYSHYIELAASALPPPNDVISLSELLMLSEPRPSE